jgi:hypothetical protein
MEVPVMPADVLVVSSFAIRVRRWGALAAAVGLTVGAITTVPAFAQTAADPANIETGATSYAGVVNTDGTLLRSGPSENDYATKRLSKGDQITVVGMRFEWLKIAPPPGSFCLVPQALITKRGDGSIGRVTTSAATVRVGSELTPSKHKVPMRLEVGTDVKIVGEVDEFFKIEPPEGVFLYVDKRFVDPVLPGTGVKPTAPTQTTSTGSEPTQVATGTPAQPDTTAKPPVDPTSPAVPVQPPVGQQSKGDGTFVVSSDQPGSGTPGVATDPAGPIVTSTGQTPTQVEPPTHVDPVADVKPAPSTKPAVAVKPNALSPRQVVDSFVSLEKQYDDAGKLVITEQPIDTLLAGYSELLTEPNLQPASRQIVEFRVQTLQVRKETRDQYVTAQKELAEAEARRREQLAEEQELQQRVQETAITRYQGLGKLTVSSLQIGGASLYRLVDPNTGRTVVYIRTDSPEVAEHMGQFIGIKGKVVKNEKMRLTYIEPESFAEVDVKLVSTKVFAEYTPPSLIANASAGQ